MHAGESYALRCYRIIFVHHSFSFTEKDGMRMGFQDAGRGQLSAFEFWRYLYEPSLRVASEYGYVSH